MCAYMCVTQHLCNAGVGNPNRGLAAAADCLSRACTGPDELTESRHLCKVWRYYLAEVVYPVGRGVRRTPKTDMT